MTGDSTASPKGAGGGVAQDKATAVDASQVLVAGDTTGHPGIQQPPQPEQLHNIDQEVTLSEVELYQPQSGYALPDETDDDPCISEAPSDIQLEKDLSTSEAQHSLHAANTQAIAAPAQAAAASQQIELQQKHIASPSRRRNMAKRKAGGTSLAEVLNSWDVEEHEAQPSLHRMGGQATTASAQAASTAQDMTSEEEVHAGQMQAANASQCKRVKKRKSGKISKAAEDAKQLDDKPKCKARKTAARAAMEEHNFSMIVQAATEAALQECMKQKEADRKARAAAKAAKKRAKAERKARSMACKSTKTANTEAAKQQAAESAVRTQDTDVEAIATDGNTATAAVDARQNEEQARAPNQAASTTRGASRENAVDLTEETDGASVSGQSDTVIAVEDEPLEPQSGYNHPVSDEDEMQDGNASPDEDLPDLVTDVAAAVSPASARGVSPVVPAAALQQEDVAPMEDMPTVLRPEPAVAAVNLEATKHKPPVGQAMSPLNATSLTPTPAKATVVDAAASEHRAPLSAAMHTTPPANAPANNVTNAIRLADLKRTVPGPVAPVGAVSGAASCAATGNVPPAAPMLGSALQDEHPAYAEDVLPAASPKPAAVVGAMAAARPKPALATVAQAVPSVNTTASASATTIVPYKNAAATADRALLPAATQSTSVDPVLDTDAADLTSTANPGLLRSITDLQHAPSAAATASMAPATNAVPVSKSSMPPLHAEAWLKLHTAIDGTQVKEAMSADFMACQSWLQEKVDCSLRRVPIRQHCSLPEAEKGDGSCSAASSGLPALEQKAAPNSKLPAELMQRSTLACVNGDLTGCWAESTSAAANSADNQEAGSCPAALSRLPILQQVSASSSKPPAELTQSSTMRCGDSDVQACKAKSISTAPSHKDMQDAPELGAETGSVAARQDVMMTQSSPGGTSPAANAVNMVHADLATGLESMLAETPSCVELATKHSPNPGNQHKRLPGSQVQAPAIAQTPLSNGTQVSALTMDVRPLGCLDAIGTPMQLDLSAAQLQQQPDSVMANSRSQAEKTSDAADYDSCDESIATTVVVEAPSTRTEVVLEPCCELGDEAMSADTSALPSPSGEQHAMSARQPECVQEASQEVRDDQPVLTQQQSGEARQGLQAPAHAVDTAPKQAGLPVIAEGGNAKQTGLSPACVQPMSASVESAGSVQTCPPDKQAASETALPSLALPVSGKVDHVPNAGPGRIWLSSRPCSATVILDSDRIRLERGIHFSDATADMQIRLIITKLTHLEGIRCRVFDTSFYKTLLRCVDPPTSQHCNSVLLSEVYTTTKKWAEDVDLFKRDFLLIPVQHEDPMQSLSTPCAGLAIVEHPGCLKSRRILLLQPTSRCSDMSSAVRDCLQAYLAAQWLLHPFQEMRPVSLTPQQAMKKFANTPLVLVNMPQSFSVGHRGCDDQVAQLKCIEAWCQCCAIGDTPTEDMLRRCCDPAGIAVLRGELLKRVSALAVQELSIPSVEVKVDKTPSWAVDTESLPPVTQHKPPEVAKQKSQPKPKKTTTSKVFLTQWRDICFWLDKQECLGLTAGMAFSNDVMDVHIWYIMQKTVGAQTASWCVYDTAFYHRLSGVALRTRQSGLGTMFCQGVRYLHEAGIWSWTQGINIFQKEFLLLPVTQKKRKGLAVIWHPGSQIDRRILLLQPVQDTLDANAVADNVRTYLVLAWQKQHCTQQLSSSEHKQLMATPCVVYNMPHTAASASEADACLEQVAVLRCIQLWCQLCPQASDESPISTFKPHFLCLDLPVLRDKLFGRIVAVAKQELTIPFVRVEDTQRCQPADAEDIGQSCEFDDEEDTKVAWRKTARCGNRQSKASSKSCRLAHPGDWKWFDPCDSNKVELAQRALADVPLVASQPAQLDNSAPRARSPSNTAQQATGQSLDMSDAIADSNPEMGQAVRFVLHAVRSGISSEAQPAEQSRNPTQQEAQLAEQDICSSPQAQERLGADQPSNAAAQTGLQAAGLESESEQAACSTAQEAAAQQLALQSAMAQQDIVNAGTQPADVQPVSEQEGMLTAVQQTDSQQSAEQRAQVEQVALQTVAQPGRQPVPQQPAAQQAVAQQTTLQAEERATAAHAAAEQADAYPAAAEASAQHQAASLPASQQVAVQYRDGQNKLPGEGKGRVLGLYGPTGSGKTVALYKIANELLKSAELSIKPRVVLIHASSLGHRRLIWKQIVLALVSGKCHTTETGMLLPNSQGFRNTAALPRALTQQWLQLAKQCFGVCPTYQLGKCSEDSHRTHSNAASAAEEDDADISKAAPGKRALLHHKEQELLTQARVDLQKCTKANIGSLGQMVVLLLDKMDCLVKAPLNTDTLADLFELTEAPGARLIVVGTAPSANIINTIKKRLNRFNCEPSAFRLAPLNQEAVRAVLEKRIQLLPGGVFTQGAASALTWAGEEEFEGNMRSVLQLAQQAVEEAAEAEDFVEGTTHKLVSQAHVQKVLKDQVVSTIDVTDLPIRQRLVLLIISRLVQQTIESEFQQRKRRHQQGQKRPLQFGRSSKPMTCTIAAVDQAYHKKVSETKLIQDLPYMKLNMTSVKAICSMLHVKGFVDLSGEATLRLLRSEAEVLKGCQQLVMLKACCKMYQTYSK